MSKLAIKFSPHAFQELSDITTHLLREADPHFARRQLERLKRALSQLRGFPDMGTLCVSSLGAYRQWSVAGYVVFYVSDTNNLSILHVLNETQVPSMHLNPQSASAA
jgi:plasmid stabilization system protein ParE